MRNAARIFTSLLIVAAVLAAGPGSAAAEKVVKRPVTFEVVNVNRSLLRCASDGDLYEVKGHLIGPESKVDPGAGGKRAAATLYLHDFAFGEFFWSFGAVPRYDYAAALARAGHVSVVVDRLGYGASGHPEGDQTCLGAQADVAHQIVDELRSGEYAVEGGEPPRFGKVALAGHYVGALIANLEAFSFKDVDALVAMSYTPQVTVQAFENFYESRAVCDRGGEPTEAGATGYTYISPTESDFDDSAFHSAAPAVVAAANRLRARDPCGDGASIIDALVLDLKSLSQVKVPVLLVCGREDAVIPSFACPYTKRRYSGSGDVSLFYVAKAGHALTLERSAPAFRRRVAAWLGRHGL
jgi:pimeloyl-ACP methyl ester carboxylesterase